MIAILCSLTWEFVNRHSWLILIMLAAANGMPLLVISAISSLGVDLNSPELAILPLALIPYCVCVIALAVVIGQGSISRLYLKPISNLAITSLFFVSGGLLTLLAVGASIWLWRLLYDLQWPLARPMLLTLSLWAGLHPSLRVNARTVQRIAEIFIVVIFFWYWSMRFQVSAVGSQTVMLDQGISALDLLLAFTVISSGFIITRHRLANDRCGRTASRLVEVAKKYTLRWDQRRIHRYEFTGPTQAFLWYEWTLRGKPLLYCLGAILSLLCVASTLEVLFSEQSMPQTLTQIREGLPPVILMHILLAGSVGLFTMSMDDQSVDSLQEEDRIEFSRRSRFGDYSIALPLTDLQMARAIQISILKTIGIAVGWMAVGVAIVYGISFILGITWSPNELDIRGWLVLWTIAGLGSWAAMANGSILAFLASFDRRWIGGLCIFLLCLYIAAEFNWRLTLLSVAVVSVLMTASSFYKALRQQLLSPSLAVSSLFMAALIGFSGWMIAPGSWSSDAALWIVILVSATLLPLSAMPQVVSFCRHT